MKKMNKKGFTIVELVIVIAVIAILSAVLIPTFSGVVDNAKKTAAVADAKAAYQEYVIGTAKTSTTADKHNFVYEYAEGVYVVIENGEVNKNTFKTLDEAAKELGVIADVTTEDAETAAVTYKDDNGADVTIAKLYTVAKKTA